MGQAPLAQSGNSEATVNEKIIRPSEDRRIIHGNGGSHPTMGFKLRNLSYLAGSTITEGHTRTHSPALEQTGEICAFQLG